MGQGLGLFILRCVCVGGGQIYSKTNVFSQLTFCRFSSFTILHGHTEFNMCSILENLLQFPVLCMLVQINSMNYVCIINETVNVIIIDY